MPTYLRGYCERAAAVGGAPGTPIRFRASTDGIARDKFVIDPDAWALENFRANPVFLWVHDYMGQRGPIGRVDGIEVKDRALWADVTFDQEDEFARQVESKYRRGFLNAVSVGWDTQAHEPTSNPDVAGRITKAELLDVSAVPVPGDPGALMERQKRVLADFGRDLLAAIEPENPDTVTYTARLTGADRTDTTTVVWPTVALGSGTHVTLTSPTHLGTTDAKPTDDPSARATWEETAAAMVRFLAPFAQRPDGTDREAEYRRLAREYARHKKVPPEPIGQDALDAMGPDGVRGLFLEGEPDLHPDLFAAIETRAGAVLSTRNRDDLGRAIELIQGVLQRAKKEPDAKPDDELTDDERAMDFLQSLADGIATGAAA